jgi:hypothetical protein
MAERLRWDDVLALGYAAEQLFIAGQLLTSDVVPKEEAVEAACKEHIAHLLELKQLLPARLVAQLQSCFEQCHEEASLEPAQAEALGRKMLAILDDLRRVLNGVATCEEAEWYRAA